MAEALGMMHTGERGLLRVMVPNRHIVSDQMAAPVPKIMMALCTVWWMMVK
jgi:hypothetical protein